MGKLLTVDDLEIIFEKQNDNHDCRWCVYVRARKGHKEKNILMIIQTQIHFLNLEQIFYKILVQKLVLKDNYYESWNY